MKTKLRIAMIGSGFIAGIHSNAFRQVTHFFDVPYELELAVICGRDAAKLERVRTQWGWAECQTDWRQVIDRKDIDVVDIATPNFLHAPIAIAAADAAQTLWCEKPLASSLAEAERMAAAVRGRPTLVWFNYRHLPAVAFAHQLTQQDRLGDPFHFRAVYLNQSGNDPAKTAGWRYKRNEAGSGAAGDLLSHAIDMALYLNGPVTELSATLHTFAPGRDVDDAALLWAKFANGSIGSFEATRYGVGFANSLRFQFHGSKGMLGFNLDELNRLDYYDATAEPHLRAARSITVNGPDHPYWRNFWKPGHAIGYEHSFIATLGTFLTALANNQAFHADFDDALAAQRILDAAARSEGKWIKLSNGSAA
jgi:predicted dehydrogenase